MPLRHLLLPLFAALFLAGAAPAQDSARFEPEIAAFEAADRQAMPAPGGIVFLGSSSIRLWPSLKADFPGLPVINRGFGGSVIADSTRYLDRIVLPLRPRTIVFYAGDNDIGAGRTPAQVLGDFRALVDKVHARLPRTRVLFISIKPSIQRWKQWDQAKAANALILDYTRATPATGYIDVVPPMLDAAGQPRPELLVQDGLHMTPAGYAIWREKVVQALR